MKQYISAFFCGLIFAVGLAISGMTNPSVVLGFLDLQGIWNPSLLFVLFSAAGVYLIFGHLILKRKSPVFEPNFKLPINTKIDKKLIIGSVIFGLGWGISGVCPGQVVASIPAASSYILMFLPTMLIGMLVAKKLF